MSAGSFPIQASWPSAVTGGGPVGASVRHMVDLARFFPTAGPNWSDALATETRRHLGGCLNHIEREMRARLAGSSVHGALSALEGPFVWPAIQAQPHILSAALIAHMRVRAAVALLARQAMRAGGDPTAPADDSSGWLADDSDPRVVGIAALLAQAEGNWIGDGGEDSPMLADLPAEHFAELTWTVAAVLGHALASMTVRHDLALDATSGAVEALLAGHREEDGALARAGILARLLRGRGDIAAMAGRAIAARHMLLFAGLAAEATGLEIEAVLDALVEAPVERLVALCRAMDLPSADFRQLLLDLKGVRGGLDDDVLVATAEDFDLMTRAEAVTGLAGLRQPQPFRAKLALIATAVR